MESIHPDTLKFLQDLSANNHKDWMDDNRHRYQAVRESLINYTEALQMAFAGVAELSHFEPRKCIARINNNRRFHPDKPPYKTNFGLMIPRQSKELVDFYVHIQPENVFVATGLYHPPRERLNALRDLIDHEGERLRDIISQGDFIKQFGTIQGDQLKKAPLGFSVDHPHIDLLRYKDMIVIKQLEPALLFEKDGVEEIKDAFAAAQGFMDFLDDALRSV